MKKTIIITTITLILIYYLTITLTVIYRLNLFDLGGNNIPGQDFYCLSDDKCVTVWKRHYKRSDEERMTDLYIIVGEHKSEQLPDDNYVKITKPRKYFLTIREYIGVIWTKDNKILISSDGEEIVVKSSNGLIELYGNNKVLNDSLYKIEFYHKYTGAGKIYKKGVDYIILNIHENYAINGRNKTIMIP